MPDKIVEKAEQASTFIQTAPRKALLAFCFGVIGSAILGISIPKQVLAILGYEIEPMRWAWFLLFVLLMLAINYWMSSERQKYKNTFRVVKFAIEQESSHNIEHYKRVAWYNEERNDRTGYFIHNELNKTISNDYYLKLMARQILIEFSNDIVALNNFMEINLNKGHHKLRPSPYRLQITEEQLLQKKNKFKELLKDAGNSCTNETLKTVSDGIDSCYEIHKNLITHPEPATENSKAKYNSQIKLFVLV